MCAFSVTVLLCVCVVCVCVCECVCVFFGRVGVGGRSGGGQVGFVIGPITSQMVRQ